MRRRYGVAVVGPGLCSFARFAGGGVVFEYLGQGERRGALTLTVPERLALGAVGFLCPVDASGGSGLFFLAGRGLRCV